MSARCRIRHLAWISTNHVWRAGALGVISGVWSNRWMVAKSFEAVPKARPGDRVAVISPASAAPAISPALHEQAMRRLTEATGLIPVEYPTTRQLGASAGARAADVTAAFADPDIRAVLATIGGDDQVTVVPHVDASVLVANPKPFLGYSDNTHDRWQSQS